MSKPRVWVHSLALRCTRRLLIVLLSVYPAAFRVRCGREMIDLYCERFRDAVARRGIVGGAGLFARTAGNFVATGLAERAGHFRLRIPMVHDPNPAVVNAGPLHTARILTMAVSNIGTDIKSALKSIRRSLRLSLAAVACIALGTAASSTVLTLYSAAVLRPLPFPEASRLVRIWLDDPEVGPRQQLRLPDVRDLEVQLTTLDRFVATARSRSMWLGEGGARRVEGEAVTPGYFELLGIDPLLGRVFAPDEHFPGSEPAMLMSFGTWNAHYGADPEILGSSIRTASRNYTVVGVLPPSFLGTIEDDIPDIEFWVPMTHDRMEDVRQNRAGSGYIWTIGRLASGVDLAQAEEEVHTIGTRIAQANPETRGPMAMSIEPFGENWREDLRGRNHLLLGAAALLLLVAASNAAGLFTTRSLAGRREQAVRAALGAGRIRLIRLVFVETSLLTGAGAAAGTLLAPSILRVLMNLAPKEVPDYVSLTLDARALLLVLVVLAATALLAGTMPAVLGSRVHPASALRGRGATAGGRERKVGDSLVVAEVALTTVLVVTAGLLLKSYQSFGDTDLGFRTERLLRMAIFVGSHDVDRVEDLNTFNARLRETLLSYPGVEGVGLVWPTVPPGTGGDDRISFEDMPPAFSEHGVPVHMHLVGPSFLPTMEIPLVAGRNINSSDDGASPSVAAVSVSLAELMGGADRVLGRVIETDGRDYEIVGVTDDVLYFGAVRRRQRNLDVFAPLAQAPTRLVSMAIRTDGDPSRYAAALSRRLNTLAPNSPLDWVDPMTVALDGHLRSPRFYLLLLSAFASSALALTAVGLFATLTNLVVRQTGEFGIRSALGATKTRLTGTVIRRGLGIAALGLCVGGAGALVVGYVLGRTLYGVGSFDAVTFVATAAVIGCAATLASYLPARRAARINPLQALQAE